MRVADLGCAPGGWLQVAAARVGRRGRVVGIDRLEVAPLDLPQVAVLTGDVTDAGAIDRLAAHRCQESFASVHEVPFQVVSGRGLDSTRDMTSLLLRAGGGHRAGAMSTASESLRFRRAGNASSA